MHCTLIRVHMHEYIYMGTGVCAYRVDIAYAILTARRVKLLAPTGLSQLCVSGHQYTVRSGCWMCMIHALAVPKLSPSDQRPGRREDRAGYCRGMR